MHLNNLSESQLKDRLAKLQAIIPTYGQQSFYYNRIKVDPYFLSSHGLTLSRKRNSQDIVSFQAVCCESSCDLSFYLDTHLEVEEREDLQSVLRDHDKECPYNQISANLICFKLFVRLGKSLYQENLKDLEEKKVWVQLHPQEILKIIDHEETTFQEIAIKDGQPRSIWSQLKVLDSSLGESLTRVRSSVLLALFGWNWVGKSMLGCRFCGASRQVTEFVSPLQFSLMKMGDGFGFLSAHYPWCCLLSPRNWGQILRQATIGSLGETCGEASRTWLDLECKTIQRSLLDVYSEHVGRMAILRKELEWNKAQVEKRVKLKLSSEGKQGVKGEKGKQQKEKMREEEQGEVEEQKKKHDKDEIKKEDQFVKLLQGYTRLQNVWEQHKKNSEQLILSIKSP